MQRLGGREGLQVALPSPDEAAQHLVQAEGISSRFSTP